MQWIPLDVLADSRVVMVKRSCSPVVGPGKAAMGVRSSFGSDRNQCSLGDDSMD